MKNTFFLLAFVLVATSFIGCEDEIYYGNWKEISSLSTKGRSSASMFVINDKAYLVGGYGYYLINVYFNSTWAFDVDGYSWTECDSMPCVPRKSGVAFSINGKGYYCGGLSADGAYHAELFEFDPSRPAGSQWKELSSDPFPEGGFYEGVGFAIGDCGYVGTGFNERTGISNSIFKFDPSKPEGSRWSKSDTDNKAMHRHGACAFVIGNKAYIIGGKNNNHEVKQFECFDASTERITVISTDMLKDFNVDILYRYNATAFSIGNDGYITCGLKFTGEVLRDTWRYTPDINDGKGSWQFVGDFEGPSRYSATGFSYGELGFVVGGQNGSFSTNYKDDVWCFSPNEKYNWRPSR